MAKIGEFLSRIKHRNPTINAVVALRKESDLGEVPNGLVYLLKDNICTADLPTTCCSKILRGYQSPYDATVVELIRQSKGTILGKTNMDEFAMGTDNAFSSYGQVRNPLFSDQLEARSPGGSSGGSAAAVAAGFCDVALGTDTGGSVRLPAAYCSVLGFKPSYGRISRYGVISYAQSLDTVGIFTRNFPHMREVFSILDKYDPRDPTCARPEIRQQFKRTQKRSLRIGVIQEVIVDMQPSVRAAWVKVLEQLNEEGHEIVLVSVPHLKYCLPAYFALSPGEASSNLARYDGVRYGARADEDVGIDHILYSETRSRGFGPEVQRRLLLGTFNTTAGAYDEHFLKAQKVRRILIKEFNAIFEKTNPLFSEDSSSEGAVDILLNPTAPHAALVLGKAKEGNPVEHFLDDVLTVPANVAGLPAISVPVGKSIALQIWGQYGDDETVLDVAEHVYTISGWEQSVDIPNV